MLLMIMVWFMRLILYPTILHVVYLSGCVAQQLDYTAMNAAEERFNKQHQQEMVMLMPLETMFSDRRIRQLARAAGNGELGEIEDLVASGVDVNAHGQNAAPPLFWALRENNISGFVRLLELGADPNVTFSDTSVIHLAARFEDTKFLLASLQHRGNPNLTAGLFNETPIFATIGITDDDYKESRRLLLNYGADINARTSGLLFGRAVGGKTAIMVAADLGRFDIVYELLVLGADYNLKDIHSNDLADRVSQNLDAFAAGSPQQENLQKVISWLSERGIVIPSSK